MLLSRLLIFLGLVVFATIAESRRHRTTTTSSVKSTSSTQSTPKTTSTTSVKSTSSTHSTSSTTSSTSSKSTSSTHSTSSTTTTTSSKSTSSTHSTSSTTTTSSKSTSSTHSTSKTASSTTSTSTTKSTSSTHSTSTTTASTTATTTTPLTPHGTVILPLYISPIPNAWNPLYTTLAANPELKFQLIVNPADGPGAPNSYPDSDYLNGIPQLRRYPNTIPLCYVHTSYTGRAITDVLADIQTCQNWDTYTGADIHMSGIFFDETTAIYNSDTLAYMSNITAYARSVFGPGNDTIVFNPGTIAPSQWYSLADYVVAYEDTYADYSSNVIASIPAAQRPQSLFIMYSFTGDATAQQTLVNSIVEAGIRGLFITTVAGYTAWSALMAQFCSAMDLT